ncbi:response regulator [Streptomyces sp. SBT349]|uniref:response regulator n=1 Tax=Streptomyces sp. SBT349 TaxID=1580539 RepID=UPI00066C8A7E|nr:response regulator transcription factor [Streptomyces sp. SBT349]
MTGGAGRIRVLVCDDDPLIREVLCEVMAEESDFDVVGAARDTDEAIALAARRTPAVAILDLRMPGGGGARAAREILARSPATRILTFSAYGEAGALEELRRAGVSEHLEKGVPNHEIVAAVRRLGGQDRRPDPTPP